MADTHDSFPKPAENGPVPGLSYARATLLLLGLVTVFRLFYCRSFELVQDEAYYRLWSMNLDLSYFSKGPGVALVMALGRALVGDTELGVRFFAVVLSAGTGWGIFLLGRSLFSPRVGFWALVVTACVPMYAVGSVLMTIDPISVFFWTYAALAFWRAKDQPGLGWWALTGLLVGLGMLGKYTNVAEVICFALFCAWSAPYRRQLIRPGFWLMLAVMLFCLLPVLLWNMKNDWITIQHLLHRGGLDKGGWIFNAGELLEFSYLQALVISPLIFIGLLWALGFLFLKFRLQAMPVAFRYLLSLFLPLVLFYMALSTKEAGEANWTAPSYIGGFVLMIAVWLPWVDSVGWKRRLAQGALVASVLVVILFHAASIRAVGIKPLDKLFDRSRGAEDLALQVAELQEQYGADFVIANKYGYAALVSFYHPEQPRTFQPHSDKIKNQFSFWPDYTQGYRGQSALFLTDSMDDVPKQLFREFREVWLLREVWSHSQGREIRKFKIYFCSEFVGEPETMERSHPGDAARK